MQCPEEVKLSREDGEALRTRLADDALTAADRRVLDQVLQWYFWLLFALQEARFSLKRLRWAALWREALHTPAFASAWGVVARRQCAGVHRGRCHAVARSREAVFCCQAAPRPWPLGRRHVPWRRARRVPP